MSGVTMRVAIQDVALRQQLNGLTGRARDLRRPMDAIGALFQASTDMRFEREVDPDGHAWTPLAPSTLKRKVKMGRERILQVTARLRQSVTRKAYVDHVDVGVAGLPYAAAHQFGATIQRGAALRAIYRRVQTRAGITDFVRHAVTTRSGDVVMLPAFAKKSRSNFMTRHLVGAHSIRIPARPYLGINEQDVAGANAILTRYLTEGAP